MKSNLTSVFLLSIFINSTLGQESLENGNISMTTNTITVKGKPLNYKTMAGYLSLKNEHGMKEANIFFTYYSKKDVSDISSRPITFAFNGGPGSPSCWIHLGALGPYRITLDDQGNIPSPPYSFTTNEYTWLDETDLVFIDPVYTGFSRPADGVDKNQFMSYESDVAYIADFIKLFLDKYDRHPSPKYIAGESYGSIRAVGLVSRLQDYHGIYPNGLLLISGLLDYGTLEASGANELPFALRLPILAATAWYHKKIPHSQSLENHLTEVEEFTINEYLPALFQGNGLTNQQKVMLATKIEKFTSLLVSYSLKTNLRYNVGQVNKILLESDTLVFGRMDTRLTGFMLPGVSSEYTFDPSLDPLIKAPYMSVAYEYTKKILKFDYGNLNYDIISGRTYPWDFNASNRYLSVTDQLALSLTKNPNLKVWVSGGIYDLGTPYFSAQYSLNHLWIDPRLSKNISQTWYEGGHMFYHDKACLKKFKQDAKVYFSH